jgi:photosystem II stability/assembly factor-like uncharacterized protein
VAIVAAIAAVCPSIARANGRFPLANQLVLDPMNHAHMVARATFGMLDTYDGGATWTWICEDAVGYFGPEDPSIAVTANGNTIVASSIGLSTSRDGGCSWTTRMAGDRHSGVDVAVNPMNPHEALALESSFSNGIYSVSLLKTSDDGASWTEVAPLPAGVLAETVELAPSNPDRVYVSARLNDVAQETVLLRSDDGGQTWKESTIDVPAGASAYIGAVDPHYPDVVYIRVQVSTNTLGRVHMTRDAGATWSQIWRGQGNVSGFALSADGSTLAVGGPESGVNVASTSNFVFSSPNPLGPSCLTWVGGKLFACAKEAVDGFSIGASDDLAVSFVPVLHFPDIKPRDCAADASAGVCPAVWPSIAPTIGIDAGAGDASSELPPPPVVKKVDAQGGWNCSMHASPRGSAAWAIAAIGVAAVAGRARSRGSSRSRRTAPRRARSR